MAKAMIFLLGLFTLSTLASAEHSSPTIPPSTNNEGCGVCDESSCRPPVPKGQEQCLAGVVKDVCGCCFVCALREGERCHPLSRSTSGPSGCGESLECRMRTDLPSGDAPEALCVCKRQETLCGSDGVTYSNECQLTEARYKERVEEEGREGRKRRYISDLSSEAFNVDSRYSLKAVSRGPCKTAPKIVSPPEDVTNYTGNFVALTCEATGWPVPTIEWMIQKNGLDPIPLPSDDPQVAVQSRGGPSKYEVTSWLQLIKVDMEDQATYWCVATNEISQDSARAKVKVLKSKETSSPTMKKLMPKKRYG